MSFADGKRLDARRMHTILGLRSPEETSPQERMVTVLDALAVGLWPDGDCRACRYSTADRCGGCTQAEVDIKAVSAAIAAVEGAETEADAAAAYRACLDGLAGIQGTKGGAAA